MYHMVSHHRQGGRFNKLRVPPEEFERQLAWLYNQGWQFVHVSQLKEQSNEKTVALTFDDGYRDNFLVADPLLRKFNAKATLFLTIDRHDRNWSVFKNEERVDSELASEPKLLDEDVAAMLQSGRWEIGAHGLTHANLPNSSPAIRESEIAGSKKQLADQFSRNIVSFAYPFGLYEQSDVDLLSKYSYEFGLTTQQGISTDVAKEALELKRVKVNGRGDMLEFGMRMRTGKCRAKD